MTSIARNTNHRLSFYPIFLGAILLAVLAGAMPIQFSILIVFLFAGPHNFIEFRYLLSRLPVRYSKIRSFFLIALIGTILLAGSYIALALVGRNPMWQFGRADVVASLSSYRLWNCALIFWVVALIYQRSRELPKKNWTLAYPVAALVFAFNWFMPQFFSLSIAYLHPLIAFWILHTEIRRLRPDWLPAYRNLLLSLPLLLIVFWCILATKPDLPVWDVITLQILRHAGSEIVLDVSSHLLVATHTFLEILHYVIWLLAIPLVTKIGNPFRLERIPLTVRWTTTRKAIPFFLFAGALLVVALYICFTLQFATTRYIYFAFAIIHVIAEIPLLLRLL